MKLVHAEINTLLQFTEGRPNIIVVENPQLMRTLITDLMTMQEGNEGDFVLSEGEKLLCIAKYVDLVVNPFALEINKRKVLTKLYDELSRVAVDAEHYVATQEIKGGLAKYLYELIYASDLQLTFNEDFSMKDILQAVSVKFDEDGTTMLEKLVAYFNVMHGFLGIKVFCFVNLTSYLNREELALLFQEAAYRKIYLLLLENKYGTKVGEEKLLVIDNDLCEVYSDY